MDWTRLAALAKNVPWNQLAEYGPQIAEGMKKLRKVREDLEVVARQAAKEESAAAAREAVAPLEAQLEAQSRELERLATERAELVRVVEGLETRLRTAFWLAVGGLATGVVGLVVALVG
jgi:plasmid stabilization system protein ParE